MAKESTASAGLKFQYVRALAGVKCPEPPSGSSWSIGTTPEPI